MKKIIFAASLLATTFFSAKAQDASTTTTSTDGYKPVAGDVTAEFGISSGGEGQGLFPRLGLSQQQNAQSTSTAILQSGTSPVLRFRYFLSDELALRVGLNISSTRRTDKFTTNATTNPAPATAPIEGERTSKNSLVLFNLGAEKHFAGTERLDTYIGADLMFAIAGASEKGEKLSSETDRTPTVGSSYENKGLTSDGRQSGFGFGLRFVGGADYYIAKKLYLGGEFGWGFMSFKGKESDMTKTTTAGGTETSNREGSTQFSIMPSLVAGLKVGFVF